MSHALKKTTVFGLLNTRPSAWAVGFAAMAAGFACSATDEPTPSGGAGASSAGKPSTATAGGGATGQGGNTASGGTIGSAGSVSAGGAIAGSSTTAGGSGLAGSGLGGSGQSGGGNGSGSGGRSAAGAGGASAGSGGAAGGSSAGGTGFDPCPATGDCKVLPLGDSITFGTPTNNGGYRVELFSKAVADNKHITFVGGAMKNGPAMVAGKPFPGNNEGYPGITIGNLDSQHVANGMAFKDMPHIVLLHIGTNDMYGGNPGGAPNALKKIIDDIATAVPNALIAVSSIIPLSSGNAAVMTYNATIPGIVQMKASDGKHVIFVDQYKDFPTSELGDGVHPNDAKGYPRMGGVWYTAIKQYLK